MSWLRSAISKAAEVGNKTNISRTAKTFADAVLQQAAGSAKIVQDRLVRPIPPPPPAPSSPPLPLSPSSLSGE
jgi:hypothetical protein